MEASDAQAVKLEPELVGAMEEILRKHDSQVIEHLDAWPLDTNKCRSRVWWFLV